MQKCPRPPDGRHFGPVARSAARSTLEVWRGTWSSVAHYAPRAHAEAIWIAPAPAGLHRGRDAELRPSRGADCDRRPWQLPRSSQAAERDAADRVDADPRVGAQPGYA